ncbi:PREDICTED: calmodulin-binding transcription activator 3 [Erythranthe guttata]|nr:PREDICTED: calmodulin-binding transcription activator 3 [Erythranthe guttata]|eukprot:XP_012853297.1 PREDICTED: calmodulin-binding transcription activator 3 [Erythranthe guttata]
MADSRRYALNAQLDIEQILLEAQHRWLRPAEICEILQNYKKFRIAPEPPSRPPNGSLFLFDRKVLRYFRKDGHNWRKKKDGKTVKEAHERLKAGSIDVLHCYYAHGEDNENFQRRSYWMLEEELSHIFTAMTDNYRGQMPAVPGMNFGSVMQGEKNKNPMDSGLTYELHQNLEFPLWQNVVESSAVNFQQSLPSTQTSTMGIMPGQENELLDQVFTNLIRNKRDSGNHSDGLGDWQAPYRDSLHISNWSMDQKPEDNLNLGQNTYYTSSRQPPLYDHTTKLDGVSQAELCGSMGLSNIYPPEQSGHPMENDFQLHDLNDVESSIKSVYDRNVNVEDKTSYPALKQPLLDGVLLQGLKKLDSFDRWMSKELGDVTETTMQPSSGAYWETVGNEDGDASGISNQVPLDNYILAPSLSQDQLFTITDFSPNWAYSGSEIKVLVSGRFLRRQEEVDKYKWACMFGELEVPAEIVGDGVLRCHTPSHDAGRIPFYITCSNRLACSEVREFDFRTRSVQDVDLMDGGGTITSDETHLYTRFGKLLSLESGTPKNSSVHSNAAETSHLCSKISLLLKDDTEWEQMLNFSKQDECSADKIKDQLLQKLLKEKLHVWLLEKIAEGGKGPNVLDDGGQGVLHFAAALGYDWAIPPTIAAGVSVNFRDANGWTALHWAAYYGRERTVGFLISLGAAPGALTDPTPIYTSGRPPADLASSNGHKGIAGYLAESSLSTHLWSLDLKESKESDSNTVETVSERIATPVGYGDLPHGLSMKDSLAAVRNATQAAARIHQVFRVQSFQRKQLKEYGDNEFGMSDERAISIVVGKTKKTGKHDEPVNAAVIRIQNKFRSWKGRREFLLIRQRIIKIQAHVRGHQVRKNYGKIIWSVGILDKVILRWRRKGRGLKGFKPEAVGAAGTSMVETETKEDDFDFLKEGRKQTEERLQKALARVKSMVQYPEARDQYRRLLNVVSEMQETKAVYEQKLNNPEVDFDDDLIDFQSLLEDDTFMPSP